MLPSRNISEVTCDHALLNYSIQMVYSIDVGKLIFSFLMYVIQGTTSVGLGHPSLIYALCVVAGVRNDQTEEQLFPIVYDSSKTEQITLNKGHAYLLGEYDELNKKYLELNKSHEYLKIKHAELEDQGGEACARTSFPPPGETENLTSFCFHLKRAENPTSFCFLLKQAENLGSSCR
ncbi:hypothetical protein IEQ34_012370 [Dendrobium chrysotoxum]|uniref:Uncharacterized protein n=1 Tax=Dendrobium chrysotoxum TaxID=161865 RepID=A0AAV7GSA5_DENCH|nr:hypothetical protein IEQ34_012370 [Dendrobium chrysotoxum]